jgi:murein L,D-transpeptidase YcbB/YkuD
LIEDGVVGLKTLDTLNVAVEERIRQIELNLERWRWMPKSFGERHIRVNIADFSLQVVEGEETVMQMPVIVGTQYRKTPVFSARMTYLEFAPYWTVPPTILREDKLPQIKKNLEYLKEKHFRVINRAGEDVTNDLQKINWKTVKADSFPGFLRMDPGPWNPLGRVKFMFPNKFDVYLHDTNEVSLFERNIRSLSSGCIRIKRPVDLAHYLLEKKLGPGKLRALLEATAPKKISIDPLPVHIQYWTAWVDQNDVVHFREDVYFRDLDLDIALNEPAYRVMDQLKVDAGTRLVIME